MSDQEKLKGSIPLAAIDAVEKLPEDSNSFKITYPFKHPLILQASDKEECEDWIKAIENGDTPQTLFIIFMFVNMIEYLLFNILKSFLPLALLWKSNSSLVNVI